MNPDQVTQEAGTIIGKGKHVVPPGVAVEELDGAQNKLAAECPVEVARLLDSKGIRSVYNDLVLAIINNSETRNVFGKWKDGEFIAVLDQFADDFAEAGIKVVVCRRKSGSGTLRWLEFIDVDKVDDYVPQFDVANFSGQQIKTIYCTLNFPYGVAVEEVKGWHRRQRLREKCPDEVAELIQKKDAKEVYQSLVDMFVEHGGGKLGWKEAKMIEVIEAFRPRFKAKGLGLFLSRKDEYVSHAQSGHQEVFRWIEFVDREEQPNYYPQRDIVTHRPTCNVM